MVPDTGSHRKPDYTSILDYWQLGYETLEAFRYRKRIEQVHRKVLAIHRNKNLISRNKETICNPVCILDHIISLEMTEHHNMSDKDLYIVFSDTYIVTEIN